MKCPAQVDDIGVKNHALRSFYGVILMAKFRLMNKETTGTQVLELFEDKIYPHIIDDLKILDDIQPETHGNSCTVPTAMLILSALDFIGYLLRPSGKLDDTETNIKTAFTHKNIFHPSIQKMQLKKSLFFIDIA
jgi:hypothetical protein